MKEEQTREIIEQLERGVEVKGMSPDYMNVLVGQGNIGYTIGLIDSRHKQINVVLRLEGYRNFVGKPIINMTVHSIFRNTAKGKQENVEAAIIGREVILTPIGKQRKVMNVEYSITGILTLKKEPP